MSAAPAIVPDNDRLLIDETPLQFLPSLAIALGGTNEALLLQQLHFLCKITEKARNHTHYHEGRWWVYNSYEQWREEHFPWISIPTIKRLFLDLQKRKIVLHRPKMQGRAKVGKWYAIDYNALRALDAERKTLLDGQNDTTPYQNDTSTRIKTIHPKTYQNDPSNKAETTTENTNRKNGGGIAPVPNNPPSAPDIAAAVLKDLETAQRQRGMEVQANETAILSAFQRFNKSIKEKGGGLTPITGTAKIARDLALRGETEATMKAAWDTCKANGIKPMGAFMKWIQEGYLPPQQEGHETKVVDGVVSVWVEGQGWMGTGRKAT